MTDPGISTSAGPVPLDQYLCLASGNGGSDSANSLLGQLRWTKDLGKGAMLNSLVGGAEIDIMAKGQGKPADFAAVWEYILRNKEQLKKMRIELAHREKVGKEFVKKVDKSVNFIDYYFKGKSDAAALHAMVKDKLFGIDCVGFVANYMIYIGLWKKYQGFDIKLWPTHVFPAKVQSLDAVQPLNIIVWPNSPIAIVDWVWNKAGPKTVRVDICQSTSGGPQCNGFVHLTETGMAEGRMRFNISEGTPPLAVKGSVILCGMPGLAYSGGIVEVGPITTR